MTDTRKALKVDQRLYESRRDRLRKLIELKAPPIILRNEAEIFLRCFKRRTLIQWWDKFKFRRFPDWLLWLVSAQYRAIKRENQ